MLAALSSVCFRHPRGRWQCVKSVKTWTTEGREPCLLSGACDRGNIHQAITVSLAALIIQKARWLLAHLRSETITKGLEEIKHESQVTVMDGYFLDWDPAVLKSRE